MKRFSPVILIAASLWGAAALVYWLVLGWKLGAPVFNQPGSAWVLPLYTLQPAFAAAFVVLCAAAWGDLIWPFLRTGLLQGPSTYITDRFMERVTLTLLTGFAVQGLVIFALGVLHLYPWGLLGAALPLLRPRFWRSLGHGVMALRSLLFCSPSTRSAQLLSKATLLLLAVCGVVVFLSALGPAIESDGLRYHLFGPQEYLKAGGIIPVQSVALTNLPFLTQMNFVPALWLGGATGAAPQVIHAWFWLLLLGSAYLLTREVQVGFCPDQAVGEAAINPEDTAQALLIAALASTLPVAVVIASWPFIDLSTAAFTVAAVVLLVRGLRQGTDSTQLNFNRWALLLGLMSGAAIATKTTALIPSFLTGVLVLGWGVKTRRLVPVALYGLAVLTVPAPWFIKSTVYQGNPLYPAAYGVFGGADWDKDTDDFYKSKSGEKGFNRSVVNLLASPFDVTARSHKDYTVAPSWVKTPEDFMALPLGWRFFKPASPGFEDHNPGPAFLALLPLALLSLAWLLRNRSLALATGVGAHAVFGWLVWYATYQSVRFLIVPLMLGIVLGGVAAFRLARSSQNQPLMSGVASGLLLVLLTAQLTWPVQYQLCLARGLPVYTALGFQHPVSVLEKNVSLYKAFQAIERDLQPTPNERVFLIGNYKGFHAKFPIVTADFFDRPLILTWIRETASTEDLLAYMRNTQNIRYVLFDLGELRAYREAYFKPRFSPEEWARYLEVETALFANPKARLYEEGNSVYVIDLDKL